MVRLVRFHELMDVPRLPDCQQKLPAPSCVNGAVIVALTGLQVEPATDVTTDVGVFVLVGEAPGVGVLVLVAVTTVPGVEVRVGEAPTIWVGEAVFVAVAESPGVAVREGVVVIGNVVTVRVRVAVGAVPPEAVRGIFATPDVALMTMLSS